MHQEDFHNSFLLGTLWASPRFHMGRSPVPTGLGWATSGPALSVAEVHDSEKEGQITSQPQRPMVIGRPTQDPQHSVIQMYWRLGRKEQVQKSGLIKAFDERQEGSHAQTEPSRIGVKRAYAQIPTAECLDNGLCGEFGGTHSQ